MMVSYVSGGTLTKSIANAAKRFPLNPYVIAIRDQKVEIILINKRAPDDVCKYRKLLSNKFGDVQDVNIIEMLDEPPAVRAH